jgi:hypothetical protein
MPKLVSLVLSRGLPMDVSKIDAAFFPAIVCGMDVSGARSISTLAEDTMNAFIS